MTAETTPKTVARKPRPTPSAAPTALVLGVDERSALTVIRSLGRKGVRVTLGSDYPESLCRYSRYVADVVELPHAGKQPEIWADRLESLLRRRSYDLVVPTSDNYLVGIVRHRDRLAPLARLAVPDDEGFEHTYRKDKTFELAARVGVPRPRTRLAETSEEARAAVAEIGYPVVVKPVSSQVWRAGSKFSLTVSLARDEASLESVLGRVLPICPVLLQSFHRGTGVGQEFLMFEGEPVAEFQHARVHEPPRGGGSSYRRSEPLDPELREHSLAMLHALRWTGVAMVEYKRDAETGRAALMEINGRFWGSLPLAVASGVDFPWLLFDMLVNGRTSEPPTYRLNIHCRHLTRDINWFVDNLRVDRDDPLAIHRPTARVLAEIGNVLLLRERFDALTLDDPRPGLEDGRRFLRSAWGRVASKARNSIRRRLRKSALYRSRCRRRLVRALRRTEGVVFVCKGNICRSPFAEAAARRGARSRLKFSSTGLLEMVGRPSPAEAVEAGSAFDADLSGHRSTTARESMFDGRLAIAMDDWVRDQLVQRFPSLCDRVFLLGEISPERIDVEAIDPYGGPPEGFSAVFQRIADDVEKLLAAAEERR